MSQQQLCRLNVVLATDERRQANFQLTLNESLYKIQSLALGQIGITENGSPAINRPTHFLRYQRKLLTDLSISIRLSPFWTSSLGQSVVRLELVPLEALNFSELKLIQTTESYSENKLDGVLVALQSPQGRHQARFKPTTSLWQCLVDFENISQKYCLRSNTFHIDIRGFNCRKFQAVLVQDNSPCIHLPELLISNQKFFGLEQLCGMRLTDLGFANGSSCLIRLCHKPTQITPQQLAECLPSFIESRPVVGHDSLPKPQNFSIESHSKDPQHIGKPAIVEDYDIELKIFETGKVNLETISPDLPDSFYELSQAEFQRFYATSQHHTRQIVNGPALISKSTQERLQNEKAMAEHPFTKIRFRFPDRLVIERRFRTNAQGEELAAFLRSTLRHSPPFILTIGPPMKVLKETESLFTLKLYPASIVNIIWQLPDASLLQSQISTTSLIPNAVIEKAQASELEGEPSVEPAWKRPYSPPSIQPAMVSETLTAPKTVSTEKKVPKWFKPFK